MNHYINEDGLTVFTSDYHRKKGSCCHSNCLHCPFGTTLKNFGVKIHLSNEENKQMRDNLFQILFGAPDGVMGELLGEAFGKPKNQKVSDYQLLTLKDVPCGLIRLEQGRVVEYKLLGVFSNQGIDESYLNSLL